MSPAVDANVALGKAPSGQGEIFKNVKAEENVGGKAINVARWLAIRGDNPKDQIICAGLLGEDNAEPFAKEFAKFRIVDKMTRVPGSTRRNEMITWPGGSFKLNQAAFPDLAFDATSFMERLDNLGRMADSTVAILSGSLPKCCGNDFYARAVAALKANGAFVVLDASGEPMRLALDSHPDLIKPNAEECEALVGFIPKEPDDFKRATSSLHEKACHVIISDGAAGAWFDGEFVSAPEVTCVDTTSAGDTLLAEFCHQTFHIQPSAFNLQPSTCREAARFAVAAGSAAVEMPGSNPPSVDRVVELCKACQRKV